LVVTKGQFEKLSGGGRTAVERLGDVVHRETGPWARSVHALLNHLEAKGFYGAPRVVGSGFDKQWRETLSFVEGTFVHPHAWTDEGLFELGTMLRGLHTATADFRPPRDAVWRQWFGRDLTGNKRQVFGHCDLGPWNVVARDGKPVAFIDWEVAGPVDALIEFAQTCWLNVQLHDDDIAERQGLPSAETRALQVRLMADAYGLARRERAALLDSMVVYALRDAADQISLGRTTPDNAEALWGAEWRAGAGAWMLRQRKLLARALA
jgi:hypothetical protein